MVAIVAMERLHVERYAGIHGKGLEPFAYQFGIKLADLRTGELHFPNEKGAARRPPRKGSSGLNEPVRAGSRGFGLAIGDLGLQFFAKNINAELLFTGITLYLEFN